MGPRGHGTGLPPLGGTAGVGRRSSAYRPDAVVYHIPHYSDPSKNHETNRRNTDYFLRKHPRFDMGDRYHSSDAVALDQDPDVRKDDRLLLDPDLGTVTTGIRDLAKDAPALVIGTWPENAPRPSETTESATTIRDRCRRVTSTCSA